MLTMFKSLCRMPNSGRIVLRLLYFQYSSFAPDRQWAPIVNWCLVQLNWVGQLGPDVAIFQISTNQGQKSLNFHLIPKNFHGRPISLDYVLITSGTGVRRKFSWASFAGWTSNLTIWSHQMGTTILVSAKCPLLRTPMAWSWEEEQLGRSKWYFLHYL